VTQLLALLLRAAVVVVLLRLFLRFVAGLVRGVTGVSTPRAEPARDDTRDLVRDRVCNTFLPRSRALTAMVAGEQRHFCSESCRDAALGAGRRAS